ncbi:MAG TPA: tail fiber protein [Rudaea sp.]
MASPFLGEIYIVPYNFAPRGFAFCNGQILSIAQNTALFALLGTTYGGNGTTNFALPDLQGRTPIGAGQGAGLSNRTLGELGGATAVTLGISAMPSHTHAVATSSAPADRSNAQGNHFAAPPDPVYSGAPSDTSLGNALTPAGGGQPHNNLSPYLVVNFVIALQGIFPSRN